MDSFSNINNSFGNSNMLMKFQTIDGQVLVDDIKKIVAEGCNVVCYSTDKERYVVKACESNEKALESISQISMSQSQYDFKLIPNLNSQIVEEDNSPDPIMMSIARLL